MRAMILAAGLGTRLYPITKKTPKCMLPVVNKPVIERAIENLKNHHINDVIINIHQSESGLQTEEYLGTGSKFGINIAYSEEETLLGTAGGVKKASWFFDPETTIILSGDGVFNLNITEFVEVHHERRGLATINLSYIYDTSQYGVVVVDDNWRIKRFQEKPKPGEAQSNLVNTGIYAFERKIFDLIPDGEYDFGKELFPRLLKENIPFYGYYSEMYWNDIGTIDVFRQVHMDILMKKVNLPIPGKETRPGINVGINTYIDEDAELIPPVAIGNNVIIERYARLKGPLSIADSCRIEENVYIEKSIVLPGVFIGKGSEIKNAVIGGGARILQGVTLTDNNIIGPSSIIGEYSTLAGGIKIDADVDVPGKSELRKDVMMEENG
ncbi:TPA: hypothetical protein DCX16_01390 [bacterium]|nr:hypothetical protein [bacterium]